MVNDVGIPATATVQNQGVQVLGADWRRSARQFVALLADPLLYLRPHHLIHHRAIHIIAPVAPVL